MRDTDTNRTIARETLRSALTKPTELMLRTREATPGVKHQFQITASFDDSGAVIVHRVSGTRANQTVTEDT